MRIMRFCFAALAVGRNCGRTGWAFLVRRRSIASPCLLLLIVALLAIEMGAVRRTETVVGPFPTEAEITRVPTDSQMLFARVGRDNPWKLLLVARGDTIDAQRISTLRFAVNGEEYASPHAVQDRIRRGETGIFAHWVKSVRFALPAGVENGPGTSVQMSYALQFRSPWTTAVLAAALIAILYPLEKNRPSLRYVLRAPAFAAPVLAVTGASLAIVYGVSILFALANDWALPTTAPIVQSSIVQRIAVLEPHFAEVVLWIAALALAFGWAARANGVDFADDERRATRMFGALGLPIFLLLLVFSASAQWSGLWRPGDITGLAIGGLIPFSDPNGYWGDANDFIKDGAFSSFSARRPLSQVFRTTVAAAGGFNYSAMVLLQCVMLALAAFAACTAVARWLGIWAGIGFAALTYVTARQFAPTALTEPIGYFWALAAVPFFVDALRTRSLAQAVVAIAILSIALWTRMGSMFTLPALVLWIALAFGQGFVSRVRNVALVCLALSFPAALNFGAAKVYADDVELVGGNFSFTLCGISVGGIWSDCPRIYADEIPQAVREDPKMLNAAMYQKAFENIVADPSVAARRLADAAMNFVKSLPGILTQGYQAVPPIFAAGTGAFVLLSVLGLYRARRFIPRAEWGFWMLFWISVIASAAFVYFDDGRRVMIAVYPLACLFLVRGWVNLEERPAALPAGPLVMRARSGAALAGAICCASFVAPLVVHQYLRPSTYVARPQNSADAHFVFGGPRVTGFLVVDDREERRPDVPTVLLSDFVQLIERAGLEDYQRLVTPDPPPTPFAFVSSPSLVLGEPTNHQFIAPPELLTRGDIEAWRLEATPYGQIPGNFPFWLLVRDARPLY